MADPSNTLYVVYDNVSLREDLRPDWGFSCFLPGQGILFDTGSNGALLLENMRRMGLRLEDVQSVVLSHAHWDHVGGLSAVLSSVGRPVTVFLPGSFPDQFVMQVEGMGAECRRVRMPRVICPGVHTTGELGIGIPEQAMVLDTNDGLVIVTGCAHPGILDIVKRARDLFGRKVDLLVGGFHLMYSGAREVEWIGERLKSLEVEHVAPAHCTGKEAIEILCASFGDRARRCGVGWSFPFSELRG